MKTLRIILGGAILIAISIIIILNNNLLREKSTTEQLSKQKEELEKQNENLMAENEKLKISEKFKILSTGPEVKFENNTIKITDSQWSFEISDVSEDKKSVVYASEYDSLGIFGIYAYSIATRKSKLLWSWNEPIGGRGAGFGDDYKIKLSPKGDKFFFERTGTSLPSPLIIDIQGNIIYEAPQSFEARFHPEWINNTQLIMVPQEEKNLVIYDTNTQSFSSTNIPFIQYPRMNMNKNAIIGFRADYGNGNYFCPAIQILIFSYPEGKKIREMKGINNAHWVSSNKIEIEVIKNFVPGSEKTCDNPEIEKEIIEIST